MGDLKSRLHNATSKLLRRGSNHSEISSAGSDGGGPRKPPSTNVRSNSLNRLPEVSAEPNDDDDDDHTTSALSKSALLPQRPGSGRTEGSSNVSHLSSTSRDRQSNASTHSPAEIVPTVRPGVTLTLEEPTPIPLPVHSAELTRVPSQPESAPDSDLHTQLPSAASRASSKTTSPRVIRRQSLVATSNERVITTLLEPETPAAVVPSTPDYFTRQPVFNASMLHRKIWVKRPSASATLVQIREDDLVDDVRDMILKKYANSLGRSFDAPDVTLRIVPRDSTAKTVERTLGPEEEMCRTLDAYYPGGQTVNEALVIDVPQRRTPRPSPRVPLYYPDHDETRPVDNASEYFPPMPIVNPLPALATNNPHEVRASLPHAPHSIAVLHTGQLPPLPSPGGTRRLHHGRPKYPRHNTASPTTLIGASSSVSTSSRQSQRPRHDSTASSDAKHPMTGSASLPTPPAPVDAIVRQNSTPPTPRVASPRPHKKRTKSRAVDAASPPAGILDSSVPPINVLIVEDNIINLRVLGAFMQRLKVRWQRAMNGKEAVTKWRAGGFHLVLMDIQLPIMNGLEATKEIRRLERVNSIGVFSSGSSEAPQIKDGEEREMNEDDRLGDKSLFKSPVIIVALTASSLQSDRHEALAAGCNDFLTKPVNFVWLERKVKEWGCMQALIDFDGWRKWKDFVATSDTTDSTSKISTSYRSIAGKAKASSSLSPTSATSSTNGKPGSTAANGIASDEKKGKRKSLGVIPPPSLPEEETPPLEGLGSK